MPGANWGDKTDYNGNQIPKDFFNTIEKISVEIGDYLRNRGMYISQVKEKYGTCRVYCNMTFSLGALFFRFIIKLPNPIFYRCHSLLIKLDNFLYSKSDFFSNIMINRMEKVYKKAYEKACKKYPEYRMYILDMADHEELLCEAGLISVNELRLYGWSGDSLKNSWEK